MYHYLRRVDPIAEMTGSVFDKYGEVNGVGAATACRRARQSRIYLYETLDSFMFSIIRYIGCLNR